MREVALGSGTIRYRDTGEGEPLVFVHGLLTNGLLWRKVVAHLEPEFRCIVPDWPLGSHSPAMKPDADLTPPALASLVVEFLDALGIERATLVGNDTGGALCQLVAASHPDRVARLVLTSCDAFANFPPRMFGFLTLAARMPVALRGIIAPLRLRPLRRLPIAYGWLAKRPIDKEASDAYLRPFFDDAAVRRDLAKVLRGISSRYTLEGAEALRTFDRPVLIAWAREDRLFPPEHARKLAELLPNARLEWVDDSYTFLPEDQPEHTAELIAAFALQPTGRARSAL